MLEKNLETTPFTFTFSKSTCQLFFSVEIPSWMGLSGPQLAAVPGLWVGIPLWMGFSRPQLVVVSGLFWWESLDGWDFLGHNLLLSQASFSSMEFWLSRSLSHELFSFFTMEF
jgi:hypothetical protein